jgi:hypothetical protein
MLFRAALTQVRCFTSSVRARVLRCAMSRVIPILATRSNGMRHRVQGQRPRFRMPARRILQQMSYVKHLSSGKLALLLLVVCRICEYTRVETPPNVVTAFNSYSMLIRFQEFIVKNNRPLCMVDFSVAMRHECTVRPLAANVLCCKSFEGIWELSFKRIEDPHRKPNKSHAPSPGKQCVRTPDRTVSTSYSLTHSLLQDKQAIVWHC